MSGGFLSDPASIIKIGDKLKVKISGFNDNHQIKLSSPEFKATHPGVPRQSSERTSAGSPRQSYASAGRPRFEAPRREFKNFSPGTNHTSFKKK